MKQQSFITLFFTCTFVNSVFTSSYQHEPCDHVVNSTCKENYSLAALHKYSIIKCMNEFAGESSSKCIENMKIESKNVSIDSLEHFVLWMCHNQVDFIDICSSAFDCKMNLTDEFYLKLVNCSRRQKQLQMKHMVCDGNLTHVVHRESSMFNCLKYALDSKEGRACLNKSLGLNVTLDAKDGQDEFVKWFCESDDVKRQLHRAESTCLTKDEMVLRYGDCLRL